MNYKEAKRLFAQEENDLKALKYFSVMLREKRMQNFLEKWYPVLNGMYPVSDRNYVESECRCRIQTGSKYGNIDFYPKSNRVQINDQNKWISPGLKWIVENLIKK
jgi:hypothetical protein